MMDSKMEMNGWFKLAWVLMIVGGLNWGLVGIGGFMHMNWNVVNLILGTWPQVEWLVYVLVGIATLVKLSKHAGMLGMKK